MLNFFRERTRLFIWIVIVAFIGFMVMVWGLNISQKRRAKDYVIKVNDTKITDQKYREVYSNYTQQIRKAPKSQQAKLYQNARQKVIEQLINQALIEQVAKKYQVLVTPEEIMARIREYDAFKTGGYFDPEKFNSYRKSPYFKLQWPYIWENERQGLLNQKIQNIFYIGYQTSNIDVKYKYFFLYGKHYADIIKINPSERLHEIPTPSYSALRRFYKQNKNQWEVPQQRKISYIYFAYPDYFDSVTITDEEINEYFNKNKDKFAEIQEVKARHILIKVPKNATPAEAKAAKQKIDHIYEMLKEGADFVELAKKYSEDASAFSGGDLGWFPRGKMVKPFEDVTFSLKKGEFSKPFRTQFGYHIVLVEDQKKGEIPPMEQLRPKIEKELRVQKAQNLAWQEANDAASFILSDTDFDTVVAMYPNKFHISPFFKRTTDSLPILGNNIKDIVSSAFSLPKGGVSFNPLSADSGYCIIRVTDIKDSYIPSFRKVRKKVLRAYKIGKIKEKYQNLISRYAKHWQNDDKYFRRFLKRHNLKLENDKFSRAKRNYEYPLALQQAIVESKINSVIDTPILSKNSIYFAKKYRISYDSAEFENDRPDFYHAYVIQKAGDILNLWLTNLKKQAKIDYAIYIKPEAADTSTLGDTATYAETTTADTSI